MVPNVQFKDFNIGLKNWRKSGEIWLNFGEKVAIFSIDFVAPKVAILEPQFGSLEKNKLETLVSRDHPGPNGTPYGVLEALVP